jgi:hypothetical protein
MSFALYTTIWLALAAFVAGEAGKRRRPIPRSAWSISLAGALLCVVHILIALGHHHHWNHDAAVRETARQTAAVYGLAWGGGVYVNYAFVAAWMVDLWWWGTRPAEYFARSGAALWGPRAFFFVIIFNAVVVFASPMSRLAGMALTVALILAWTAPRYESRSTSAGSMRDAR